MHKIINIFNSVYSIHDTLKIIGNTRKKKLEKNEFLLVNTNDNNKESYIINTGRKEHIRAISSFVDPENPVTNCSFSSL